MENELHLEEFEIIDKSIENTEITFTVVPSKPSRVCEKCGSLNTVFNGEAPLRYIRDLPSFGYETTILLKQKRIWCKDCNSTSLQTFKAIGPRDRITKRLRKQIEKESLDYTFSDVAKRYGLTDTTVKNAFNEFVNREVASYSPYAPRVLGIDEVHLNRSMRCVIADIESHGIVDLLPKRTQDYVMQYIDNLPGTEQIEIVTMDMWNPYRCAIQETLPKAKIVVDKFHVMVHITNALETVRKSIPSQADTKTKKTLKNSRWILLKNQEDLKSDELWQREIMLKAYPELKTAYELKESFRKIYQAGTLEEAVSLYTDWKHKVPSDSPFSNVVSTIDNWNVEIFNYFKYPYTNGIVEALNNVIKDIEKRGKGYSFDVLRAKVLFGTKATKKPEYRRKPTVKKDEHLKLSMAFDFVDFAVPDYSYEQEVVHGSLVDIYELPECL